MADDISYLNTSKTLFFLGVTICVMPCYFAVSVLAIIADMFLVINTDIVVFLVGCVTSNMSLLH